MTYDIGYVPIKTRKTKKGRIIEVIELLEISAICFKSDERNECLIKELKKYNRKNGYLSPKKPKKNDRGRK
jgi:hypothetical protein